MIVYLDTNIIIYTVEMPGGFGPRAMKRLGMAQTAGDELMASDLTRMECLVGPLKKGSSVLEAAYRTFFAAPGLKVVPITGAVCDRAAAIRAALGFKSMDALHLAAAVEHGAKVFLTNDTRLNAFTGLTVEVLP
jgi:predicted nucleic acid-binding protein